MAYFQDIITRSHKRHSLAKLNALSDWQLEDVGMCRADVSKAHGPSSKLVSQPKEAWPSA